MRSFSVLLALASFLLALPAPALAHPPGTDLDEPLAGEGKYFETVDRPAPGFDLLDAAGESVRLSDFAEKVVVLNFIYAGCPDVCPLHSEKIADIQSRLNDSPLRERVQFISITTDPEHDTTKAIRGYGEAHALDPVNWVFLTRRQIQPKDVTRTLARKYDLEFIEADDGQEVLQGVVTHIIDRNGRYAARFHGLRFGSDSLVRYVNGLLKNVAAPPPPPKTWFDHLPSWF